MSKEKFILLDSNINHCSKECAFYSKHDCKIGDGIDANNKICLHYKKILYTKKYAKQLGKKKLIQIEDIDFSNIKIINYRNSFNSHVISYKSGDFINTPDSWKRICVGLFDPPHKKTNKYFYGFPGTGKTTIALAILFRNLFFTANYLYKDVSFRVFDWVKLASISSGEIREEILDYPDYILIDDVRFHEKQTKSEDILLELYNMLGTNTVFLLTSNLLLKETIKNGRLIDRLQLTEIGIFVEKSYRSLEKIY